MISGGRQMDWHRHRRAGRGDLRILVNRAAAAPRGNGRVALARSTPRRATVFETLATAMLAVVVGCTAGSSHSAARPMATTGYGVTGTTLAGPAPTRPFALAPPAAGSPELLARLLVTVPAGYVQQPDSAANAGPLDLAIALQHDVSPDAQTVFGLLGGYERVWQTPDQRLIIEFIYQFKSDAGASAYNERVVTAARSDPQNPVTGFPVVAIPGAMGISATAAGAAGAFVFFARDDYQIQLGANAPSPTGLQPLVIDLAAQQYQHV